MRDPNSKVLQVPRKWRSKLQNGAVQMPGKTTSTRKREKNPKRNGKKKQKMQPFSISMSRYCDYKNTSHKKHPIQLNFQNIHNHCSQECSWVLCRAGDHRKIMKFSQKLNPKKFKNVPGSSEGKQEPLWKARSRAEPESGDVWCSGSSIAGYCRTCKNFTMQCILI